MVQYLDPKLDVIFSALSDATRRAILVQLLEGEARMSDLEVSHPMSLTAVTKHVKVLAKAGLISHEKRGRIRYCKLEPHAVRHASSWLHHYQRQWEHIASHMDKFLMASRVEEALKKHRKDDGQENNKADDF